ncbi:MAG: hypothetical protein M1370_00665 [Bacteroidetes bacterium]|nr:hypothetical protein [Bacteroidota bacterium]MCL5027288.1 hypothetical protein [Chloroflexota bacterium]
MKKAIHLGLLSAAMALLSLGSLLAIGSQPVSANGAPVKVILTYLSGVSNWGPTSATGVAEVIEKEGQVNVSVVGLPPLTEDTYAGWLINTTTNEMLNVGRFNADQSEVVKTSLVLSTEIPDKSWNLFLVTVEPRNSTPKAPDERKSIGGYFPDTVEANRQPAQLPKTGGESDGVATPVRPAFTSAPASTPAPAPQGRVDFGSGTLTFGVVALVAIGLGVVTRARMKR